MAAQHDGFDLLGGLDESSCKSGPEVCLYQCNECLRGIKGNMKRFQKKRSSTGGESGGMGDGDGFYGMDYDLCEDCASILHIDLSEYNEFPPGWVDLESVKRSAPFPIDLVLSVGRNIRQISYFERLTESSDDDDDDDNNNNQKDPSSSSSSKNVTTGYSILLMDLMTQQPDLKGPLELDVGEANAIFKAFRGHDPAAGEDVVPFLLGKSIVSRFMGQRDIITELVLYGRYGPNNTPCRFSIENRFVQSFKSLSAPQLDDLHPLLIQDYFMSLFSQNFDFPDPFSEAWFHRMNVALSKDNITVEPCGAELFSNQPNELQMILARVTSKAIPGRALLVLICPASNGLLTELKENS